MVKRWLGVSLLATMFLGIGLFTGGPVAAAGPAMVQVVNTSTAGPVLADAEGRTLYLYTRDTRLTSNCYDACAVTWPPLMTDGAAVAGSGIAGNVLSSTRRRDGSSQVTYNGWPLYYFRNDAAPKETRGQNVGGVWFVVSPEGGPRQNFATVTTGTTTLGTALVDASGRALYLYTRDEPNKTNCFGGCAIAWPPVESIGPVRAAGDLNPAWLGMITRPDGSTQATYNTWPLYYYNQDEKPGDVRGQNSGTVWWLMNAAGNAIRTLAAVTPAATTPAAGPPPAALPRTGDDFGPLGALAALAGLALLAGGLRLRSAKA